MCILQAGTGLLLGGTLTTTLKATIDGFEIEGPAEEVSVFMRDYMHRRGPTPALPAPKKKGGDVIHRTGRRAAKPTPCPICKQIFPSENKMLRHKVNTHGAYIRPKAPSPPATSRDARAPAGGSDYARDPRKARPWEANNQFPCDHCERRFPTEHGLNVHRGIVHHLPPTTARAPLRKSEPEQLPISEPEGSEESRLSGPEWLTPAELKQAVLDKLYPLPQVQSMANLVSQGRTRDQLADLLKVGKADVSAVLSSLLREEKVLTSGDGRGPNGYFWFRSEVAKNSSRV